MEQTLFNWVKANRQGQLKGADNKPVSAEQMEIARQLSEAPRRHLSVLVRIKAIHAQTKRTYGRPRILRELRKNGVRVGKQRLQTLM